MKSLKDLNLSGKRVLTRVDFNVPINERREVADDSRIRASVPTIQAILKAGGKPILMSHLGRPKGEANDKFSLRAIVNTVEDLTSCKVIFVEDCIGEDVVKASYSLGENEILLLENLRFYAEEEAGDEQFAEKLAKNGDVYVNDAFGTAHRAHASTAVIAQYFEEKAAGEVMRAEIENVNKALNEKTSPVTAIIGGAKVSSKIDVLENLIPKLDNLVIGGGMAYTFLKAKGGETGNSMVEEDYLQTALNILQKAEQHSVRVFLPVDSVNADSFNNDAQKEITPANSIKKGTMGLDVGPDTLNVVKGVIESSNTIIWNGPMGVFEFDNFENGTRTVGEYIVNATFNGAFSLVGGGDSVAAVKKYKLEDKVSYVSTGGGAMLEYLEGKELPGIKALS